MVLITSAVSTYQYSEKLRISLKLYSAVAASMIATSYLETHLVTMMPSDLLAIVVGCVLLAAAARAIVKGERAEELENTVRGETIF